MKPDKPDKKEKKKKNKKPAEAVIAAESSPERDGMAQATAVIGGRWKLRILWALRDGKCRYSQVKRQVEGITDVMLSQSLKELSADGLVSRQMDSEEHMRITYDLTGRGKALIPALSMICDWGNTL